MELPDTWEVRAGLDNLQAGSPAALQQLEAGEVPQDLVLRLVTGAFTDLGIPNAAALPAQLARLVPLGIAPPTPLAVTYGNRQGWEIEYTVPESNLHTTVALVPLENGRLALVRGVVGGESWSAGVNATFEAIRTSMEFTLPSAFADPFANLLDSDGGVIWHYIAERPDDPRTLRLGGLGYDPFNLIYVAGGQRGVLVLNLNDGTFVNILGPWAEDDNLVDLDIPIDARIYAANATSGDNNHIMVLNRAGGLEYGFGNTGDGPGQFMPGYPQTIAATRNADLWTVSEGHSEAPRAASINLTASATSCLPWILTPSTRT
ncbi:MAG: hypothetical protein HC915_18000 [Anaerolineae bacterium]|nr:hypothetical protein [Anaerolineae bacterium]